MGINLPPNPTLSITYDAMYIYIEYKMNWSAVLAFFRSVAVHSMRTFPVLSDIFE